MTILNLINELAMDPLQQFQTEVEENTRRLQFSTELKSMSLAWMLEAGKCGNYTYNFNWLGRPIIQYPQDIMAMQELIFTIQPDLIIETGIAHGGSLIFSASMLAMIDYMNAISEGISLNPRQSSRRVLGIDIDIRNHNRKEIEKHPMSHMISMIEGSSIDRIVIEEVSGIAKNYNNVLVCLDSNHTYHHVLAELEAYANLVSKNSYCVVFDTVIEDMPEEMLIDRPWGTDNNPKTAVRQFLKAHSEFEIDKNIESKLLITVAPDGYLKRVY